MIFKHDLDFFWKITSIITEKNCIWMTRGMINQLRLAVLYFQIYVIQDTIRYCMAVCQQICQFLGIYCFDIVTPFPKKTTKNSWEESPAASKQTRWLGNRETCVRSICRNVLFFLHIYVWKVCTIILFF